MLLISKEVSTVALELFHFRHLCLPLPIASHRFIFELVKISCVKRKGDEMHRNFIVLIAIWAGGLGCQTTEAQRIVYRSGTRIGYASMDRNGNPLITMSRRMCRRNPDLCAFFTAHERGHHRLGHFHRRISVRQAEAEADRFAAQHSSPQAVAAAQRFFARGRGGSLVHGSSQQRYARVSGY